MSRDFECLLLRHNFMRLRDAIRDFWVNAHSVHRVIGFAYDWRHTEVAVKDGRGW